MQYSFILSLLAASGAIAAPHSRRGSVDNQITVALSGPSELAVQVTLQEGKRDTAVPAARGPFDTVEIRLGKDVQQQDLRCQLLDEAGKPIVALRGANTDITFADGGNGPWTFRGEPTNVKEVICDPAFQKISPDALQLTVILQNQAIELGSQTVFAAGQRVEQTPIAAPGPFETVELSVGALVEKQNYRCQALDQAGVPLVVLRGANRDITFADGDAGLWRFEQGAVEVSRVICDPAFIKGSA